MRTFHPVRSRYRMPHCLPTPGIECKLLSALTLRISLGRPLPFFSPYPVPGTLGVNLFSQSASQRSKVFSNPYIFPPFCVIPHVCRFLQEQGLSFTICVPDKRPRPYWWPLIQARAAGALLLGRRGTQAAVLAPSSTGFSANWLLPWDFWVFHLPSLS